MMRELIGEAFTFFLLAFPALFSIINPLGGSFIFLAATGDLPPNVRDKLARKISFYSFVMLNVSMLIGAFVLKVFGISMPVLRVAGGIVIALSAWKMLTADDEGEKKKAALEDASGREAERMAFYPLTMPVTTGPGTISVAIALGTASGGWRIIKTMGFGLGALQPVHGFAAEMAAGTVIEVATRFGVPISTTHAITGAILGVGTTKGVRSVRWIWGERIVLAWVLTLPCSAFMAAIAYGLAHFGIESWMK